MSTVCEVLVVLVPIKWKNGYFSLKAKVLLTLVSFERISLDD